MLAMAGLTIVENSSLIEDSASGTCVVMPCCLHDLLRQLQSFVIKVIDLPDVDDLGQQILSDSLLLRVQT